MRIAVIDGQGGGIGKSIVEKLRKELPMMYQLLLWGQMWQLLHLCLRRGQTRSFRGECYRI